MSAQRQRPRTAMVLAAGYGKRMRPLTLDTPKPLVPVRGRALIDYGLDALVAAGVERIVVNVHYLADQIERHFAGRRDARFVISDEREQLLETGGGVRKALPLIGGDPFFLVNSDSVWRERGDPALRRLAEAWDGAAMDGLLLLVSQDKALGYQGAGDFRLRSDGRLARAGLPDNGETENGEASNSGALVYMGVAILAPALLRDTPEGPFSLNATFDRGIAEGRLFGLEHGGDWMHIGTPQGLAEAEAHLRATDGPAER